MIYFSVRCFFCFSVSEIKYDTRAVFNFFIFWAVGKPVGFRWLRETIFDSSSHISLHNLVWACAEQKRDTDLWSTTDDVVNVKGSEVEATSSVSESDVDSNTFFDTLNFEVEPAADPESRVLDVAGNFTFTVYTFDHHLKALSSLFRDLAFKFSIVLL